MEPNLFGKIVFFSWPLIIFWFLKKYSVKEAIFLAVALCSLILPSAYMVDYPLIPPLNKETLNTAALVILLLIKRYKNPIFKPGLWNKIFIGYLLIIITSTLMNSDSLVSGGKYLRGSSAYDALSNLIIFILAFMPFILGRNYFNKLKDTEYLLKMMVLFALIYTIPMLYEIRLSPQLHIKLYGYFPGDFKQQMREGGFRPVVFIGHGLGLAFWYSTCIIAGIGLYKAKVKNIKFFGYKSLLYLIAILLLCKTVSAVIYIIVAGLLLYFLPLKKQILGSLIIALYVFIYPFNAANQFIKNDDVLEYIKSHNEERAQSLETRFVNEQRLLKRAMERPYFGWSGWGRNRVFEWGKDITITDGKWIMELGVYGSFGFVFYYLLLIYPIIKALKTYQYIDDSKQKVLFSTLAIILAIGIFDSVPNVGMMPIHLLLAGALLGQAEYIANQQKMLRKKIINHDESSQ